MRLMLERRGKEGQALRALRCGVYELLSLKTRQMSKNAVLHLSWFVGTIVAVPFATELLCLRIDGIGVRTVL